MVMVEKITTTDVKRLNKNRIFRLIHYADKISRQEIADVLQLSLPTVNQNLKVLTGQDLIIFSGNFESTGGRKAQVISVNGDARYAVSVNISDSGIRVSLVNLKGEIVCSVKSTTAFSTDDSYGKMVAAFVADVIKRYHIVESSVCGVGITVPGIFDVANEMIVSAPTMSVRNYPIERITRFIPYPCRAMNDARANAYAEFWYDRKTGGGGVVADEKNYCSTSQDGKIYIMLNTGVGGCYIDNEQIRTGRNNRYGEFGHMTLHPNGCKCLCGKNGCFEAYVSSRKLSVDLDVSLEEFFCQLKGGNEQYAVIFDKYLDDLTTGINNLYIMSDASIVLGGPVARHLVPYKDRIIDLLVKKYAFDTDASYFSFANCTSEQSDAGAALTFLGDFIRNI